MIDHEHIYELGVKAIAALPDTADGIAKLLAGQEITAICGSTSKCAIAEYLNENAPLESDLGWNVSSTDAVPVPVGSGKEAAKLFNELASVETVYFPEHVNQFISRFDDGLYPDLIR